MSALAVFSVPAAHAAPQVAEAAQAAEAAEAAGAAHAAAAIVAPLSLPAPHDLPGIAFAGVIALAPQRPRPYDVPIAGLSAAALARLAARHLPHRPPEPGLADGLVALDGDREDEFDDLVRLLDAHRAVPDEDHAWLARAVATACMGANHLWQDMGLPGRPLLGTLLRTYFPVLAARNVHDMKWKKFFYRELCRRAEVSCRAPTCGACSDYANCFGPER